MTIANVAERTLAAPGGHPRTKLVLYFKESAKGLPLNMANGNLLLEMTGTENPAQWPGTIVELYVDDAVIYAGKRVGGVRLRKPAGEQPFSQPSSQ
jgi:hypothetical protein